MEWDDLHSFLAIARNRTLSAAARAMGVRQSTMSRRLDALEQRMGARLLQRTPGGYQLTPLGESVLGNAERMEAEAIAVERAVLGRDVALAGVVRVTTVDSFAARIIVPAMAALQCQHPGILVELVPDVRSLNLSRREADIAVRMARFEGNELVSRRLASFAHALYASPSYLDRHGPLTDDGTGHRLVTVLDDQAHLPEARWLADRLPRADVALRSNSRGVQLAAVQRGMGLGCLSCHLADAGGDLVRLTAPGVAPVRDMWLGVHADMRHMPRIRAVIDAIDAAVQAELPRLNPAA